MKLEIIECKGCGVLFSEENTSIKRLYKQSFSGSGQHGQYLDCPVCKSKTVIWKDWGIDYEFLKEKLGEKYFNSCEE